MHNPKWCMFYDFHTMPSCPDVGENFDFEKWGNELKECGIDFVTFAARCNLGNAYYNTKIGYRHPNLKYDLFAEVVKMCRSRNIAVSAYFNGGLSHEECLKHPEYMSINPDGSSYNNIEKNPNFFRRCCPNSSYGEHLVEMVGEVTSNYDIQGLFVDCLGPHECICPSCIKEMKEKNINWHDKNELMRFSTFSINRLCKKISKKAKENIADILLFFNGVFREDLIEYGNYAEIESIPTSWGYDNLPLYARYYSNFEGAIINMNGRFHREWGDFGGIRTSAALEYDIAYGLSNGLATTVGDHFHPRGDLNYEVISLVKKLYNKYQKYQEYFDDAKQISDIAVLANSNMLKLLEPSFFENYNMLKGFFDRLSGELKLQCSLYTDTLDIPNLPLLILPDNVEITENTLAKIEKHLSRGGKIIASYRSGLIDNKRFLPQWGIKYINEFPYNSSYLATLIMDMPIGVYHHALAVKNDNIKDIFGKMLYPCIDKQWDGEHYNYYTPPDKESEYTAVSINENVGYFAFPFFNSYAEYSQIPMRDIFAYMLEKYLPHPIVKAEELPSFARCFVTSQKSRRIVHVMSYCQQKRGFIQQIEEPIALYNIKISLRLDEKKINRVFCPFSNIELKFECDKMYCHIIIPKISGYEIVVFE